MNSDLLRVGQLLKVYKEPSDKEEKNSESNILKEDKIKINIKDNKEAEQTGELPKNLPANIQAVLEARKIFQLEKEDGVEVFGSGLKGPVGRNHVNRPEDLEKVQLRLIQLNMLSADHQESPANIRQSLGVGAITANLIPKTIKAIEKFQDKHKVYFWIEHSTRVAMMQTSSYTPGVVVPDDITYRFFA